MIAKLKLRKGDRVVVIAGKDKGAKGEIVKVFPKLSKVIVSGANIAIKHMKPSREFPQGGMVKKEMPLHISNVAYLDPKTDMPTRIGYKSLEDGKKMRYAKRSSEIIDNNA